LTSHTEEEGVVSQLLSSENLQQLIASSVTPLVILQVKN